VTLQAGIGGSCEFCSDDDEIRESTFGSLCFWFSFVLFDKEFLVFYQQHNKKCQNAVPLQRAFFFSKKKEKAV